VTLERRTQIGAALLVLLAACGGGEGGTEDAGRTSTTTVPPTTTSTTEAGPDFDAAFDAHKLNEEQIENRQWGRVWETLHPAQQVSVPKPLFVKCFEAGEGEFQIPTARLELVEAYEEPWTISGTDTDTPSVALTVKRVSEPIGEGGEGAGQTEETTDTVHLFLVDGEWRWILADVSNFNEETC